MAEPQERRRFLFGWSLWRRAHQAVAARCRAAKRAARQALGTEEPLQAAAIPPEEAKLTAEQLAVVRPLLPAQLGRLGGPPSNGLPCAAPFSGRQVPGTLC